MASPPNTGGQSLFSAAVGVKKCGYLKKQKHGHKRFFVLREPGEGLPARLEYYESEKKWRNKSAAKRVISLDCCLNISKRADAKHKHLIALYTKDEYFAVVAENEPEQDSWYRALTDLMAEGKVYDGSASNSASSLVGFDEASYGVITPVAAAYKEVWQVNLKSRGLGQSRNLTGVYRLCLSSRTISFVKLNSEVASVILQLMNIRRCGHSDSFFFIEVGRSAATGPGELWMQADDSVVAQNIHETILEAMKAMKELSEFRPRSKSQSSSTNPISVPTRRHLNNLPPSQIGLPRRSRTDSTAATSPVSKCSSCRIRTASEGDGTMTRPLSVTGSPLSPGVHRTLLSRSHTITARPTLTFEASTLQHSKSMSMPLSHSPPVATTCPRNVSTCLDSSAPRPSSCSASFSGSPSDAGFISCEEYGSSPADARDLRLPLTLRSNTPESLRAETPPSRDGSELDGYMVMERQNQNGYRRLSELDKAYRKRTYSLTTPRQQRRPPQVSSASLDEYTLMRATYTSGSQSSLRCHTASPKVNGLEDYKDVTISSNNLHSDSGYMPMMPGVAPPTPGSKDDPYMPMSPMCVSAPKQIINPRSHSSAGLAPRTDSPGSVSLEDSGYMPMWCGNKMSVESTDGKPSNGEYLYMSPVDTLVSLTPPDYILSPSGDPHLQHRQPYSYSSLPRSLKGQFQRNGSTDTDQYVVMSLQRQRIEEESNYCPVSPGESVASSSPGTPDTPSSVPSPLRLTRMDGGLVHRNRVCRPTRLALESLRTLPCMNEHPLPSEPRSPGEYINIDFDSAAHNPLATTTSASSEAGSVNGGTLSLSDYANIDVSSPVNLEPHQVGGSSPAGCRNRTPELLICPSPVSSQQDARRVEEQMRTDEHMKERGMQQQGSPVCEPAPVKDDYAEMSFGPSAPLPVLCAPDAAPLPTSPAACVKRLSLESSLVEVVPLVPLDSFLLGGPSLSVVDPNRGAKVIRADPQGRRRHSSETFSSTTTVTPVCPSFAHDTKRHSSASVENVSRSVRSSEGPSKDHIGLMCRETSAGYQNGLNYIALNLMGGNFGGVSPGLGCCDELLRFKTACSCKGGLNGFNNSPYTSLGFKETTTAAVKAIASRTFGTSPVFIWRLKPQWCEDGRRCKYNED
ncbi:insulin receptor substrate 2 isoform X1 [Kryptolebias marmoratus]|uniref:Insulin receptor substrate 2 n=1 Tax=Kryptolebias marmoratus TaxID=37003 RepID=A0A3Q3BS72_KRYMA|nr:insulin receptor substrate 2 isoform X1 [Kryptolebias marmoratus]